MSVNCRFVDGIVCCEQIAITNGYCEEHFSQTNESNEMEITENRMPKKKQPLKLMSSLKKIVNLSLNSDRLDIMKNSRFYKFSKMKNAKESSSTLILGLCQLYDAEEKKFVLNSETSFSFCADEVAEVLGITNSGVDFNFTKPKKPKNDDFPSFLNELREKSNTNKERRVSAADIKTILVKMPIDTEDDKQRFRQLLCYYIIEQVLLCSSNSKQPRSSYWSVVSDLDKFESINWAKATFDHIHDSFKEINLKLKGSNANQLNFKGATPVIEAIIFSRIPSFSPQKSFEENSPMLQMFGPRRNDMNKWNWAELTPESIKKCKYCSSGSTPVTSMMGLSLDADDEAEDEADEADVPIMDATAETSAGKQQDVRDEGEDVVPTAELDLRRSNRGTKPRPMLINEISGKAPKKPGKPKRRK